MSILETNKIQPFDGDNITLSAANNIQIQADLHVSGTVTAENFHTTTVQTTVLAQSGSTQLGNSSDDVHTIIGTVDHTGNSDITGDVTQSGDYKLTGDLLQTGNTVQTGNITLTGTGSVDGRVENTGESLHTGNTTVVGTSRISGSLQATGSINNVGFLRVTGSMETSGRVSLLNYPWPEIGSETHLFKTNPFTVNLNGGGNRPYNYGALALEHYEDSPGFDHNAFKLYMYDSHVENPEYGSELLVGPLRIHMLLAASGSNTTANVSLRDLNNGETQALMYADNIQIGVYNGDHIVFGNSTSSVTSSADTYHISSSLLHIITPDFELTGSAYFSSTLAIGGVANVSSSISQNTTTTSNVSSSLALTITNLDTATSASDSALDTRVTTAEGHIENLHLFTGSLNDTYATDAELSAVSGALATSINTSVAGLNAASSSYALAADLTVATGSINVNETNIGLLTALTGSLVSTQTAYNTASGSYITSASLAADYVSINRLRDMVTGSADFDAFKTAILGL